MIVTMRVFYCMNTVILLFKGVDETLHVITSDIPHSPTQVKLIKLSEHLDSCAIELKERKAKCQYPIDCYIFIF